MPGSRAVSPKRKAQTNKTLGQSDLIKHKLVMVTWLDAHCDSTDGWTDLDDIKWDKDLTCYSVGWLIKENEQSIHLVSHVTHDPYVDGHLQIPKGCILQTKELCPSLSSEN